MASAAVAAGTFRQIEARPLWGVDYTRYGNPNAIGSITLFPVPEPTTMVAGAMLLLPFGMSTLRMFRKTRTA